ncbi:MAG: hypothetical protein ACTSYI_03465, partial [Promethearchaeota archaeon]
MSAIQMNYKYGIAFTIIGLVISLLFYAVFPIITYFFGAYMLFFLGFIYFTEFRNPYSISEHRTVKRHK